MAVEENKALIRRFLDQVDTGDVGILDEFVSSDYQDHNPPPFPGLAPGFQGAKQAFAMALAAFSDFRHEIEDQVAEGDLVVTRTTGYGTHTGELLGIPATGREVNMTGIAVHRIVNGQLVEHWAQVDSLGLMQQLGAIPGPEQSGSSKPVPGQGGNRSVMPAGRTGPAAENKALVRQFVDEVQDRHNLAAVDQMLAPGFVDHSSGMYGTPPSREGVKQFFAALFAGLPDVRATIHGQIAERDKVVTRKTLQGTHRGEFMGVLPSGKVVSIPVIDILRISGGKIAEHWAAIDRSGLMVQLGAIPGPGSGG